MKLGFLIHQNSFDILAISETWLSDKIPNELVNIPGFNVNRKDRPSHGGMFLYNYIKETVLLISINSNPNVIKIRQWLLPQYCGTKGPIGYFHQTNQN